MLWLRGSMIIYIIIDVLLKSNMVLPKILNIYTVMEIPAENDVNDGKTFVDEYAVIPLKINTVIEKFPVFYTIISISVRAEKSLSATTMMEKPQRLT
jgi:hypothetical protein